MAPPQTQSAKRHHPIVHVCCLSVVCLLSVVTDWSFVYSTESVTDRPIVT